MSTQQRPVKYRERSKQTFVSLQATAWLIYCYSLVFLMATLWQLIRGRLLDFVLSFGVFLLVVLAARWMSDGRKNKHHYKQRKYIVKKPFPMMFLASLALGAASFGGALLVAKLGLLSAIGHGVAAIVGSWLWYGLDDVDKPVLTAVDDPESQQILALSEQSIVNIEQAKGVIANTELAGYLDQIVQLAREIVETLVDKPKKIPQARRFLYSYLGATESVIERYAKTHKAVENDKLESNFKQVLQNIVSVFSEQQQKLLENDVFDLDVDIEVLNTLLEKQGIN